MTQNEIKGWVKALTAGIWTVASLFDSVWDHQAERGYCDGRGGAEYNRVRDLWVRSTTRRAHPSLNKNAIRSFIRRYANLDSKGK